MLSAVVVILLGLLTSCANEEPSQTAFCAAVERAPKEEDASVAATLVAAEDVESTAPQEIRGEVTAIRRALETVHTTKEMQALTEPGSPVKASWESYQAYVEERCYS